MSRRNVLALSLPALLAGCFLRPPGTGSAAHEIDRGDWNRRHHRLPAALKHYERAERDAAAVHAGPLQAQAAMKRVRVIGLLATRSRLEKGVAPPGLEAPAERRAAIRQAYEEAIAVGSPRQQALARNNLAVILLSESRDQEAAELLRGIRDVEQTDGVTLPPAELYVYVFNYARALERLGDWQAAYAQYARVARMRPGFRPGFANAFRILAVFQPPRIDEALGLFDILIARGRNRQAARLARKMLATWARDPRAAVLLPILVRCQVASHQDCRRFTDREWSDLLGRDDAAPAVRAGVAEVRTACRGDMTGMLPELRVERTFPTWTGRGWRAPLAGLLASVADSYLHDGQGDVRQAFVRYAAAARLDPADTRAALYAVSLLHAARDRSLDPNGRIARLFLPAPGRLADRNDLENVIRTRVLLGRLFEREERLGPPGAVDTAIFQWQWVLDAEQDAHEARDGDMPASSEVYLQLGAAYERIGDHGRARIAYRAAQAAFERSRNDAGVDRARTLLQRLDS